MPIAAENARWSNAGSAANTDEARKTDPGKSGKEHTGKESTNAASPAATFEGRIQQEGSH
jgi:hypothetical protein